LECLERIKEEVLKCCKCPLCKTRTKPVPGEGSGKVMLVGEAPGREEDLEGRPFVGRAGKLLRQKLREVGFDEVYITNVVKCRPPNNRTPHKEEVEACKPYLEEEICCLKPELVIALGKTASKALLGFDAPLKELRGKVRVVKVKDCTVRVLVTYHPAAILRNKSLLKEFEFDLKKAYSLVYKQGKLF